MYKRFTAVLLAISMLPHYACVTIMRFEAALFSAFSFPVYPFILLALILLFLKKHFCTALLLLFAFTVFYMKGFSNTPYPLYENPTRSDIEDLAETLSEIILNTERNDIPLSDILKISGEIMNTASPKAVNTGSFMNFTKIAGVYIPFSGEAFLNSNEEMFMLPFTAVHELCHRLGFSDEGQANIHAFVKCFLSGNDAFRYSACIYALKYACSYLEDYEKSIPGKLPEDALMDYYKLVPVPETDACFFGRYSDLVNGLVHLMKNGFFIPLHPTA